MSIQLSGLASGLDTESIITKLLNLEKAPITAAQKKIGEINTKQLQLDAAQARFQTLSDTLKKFTTTSLSNPDLFKTKITSTADDKAVTATATTDAIEQSVRVSVESLATSTKATSTTGVGQLATTSTSLSTAAGGNFTPGSFTVFVNGTANNVAANTGDTIEDVLSRLRSVSGITGATIGTDGKVELAFASGTTVQLGASGDTTNFLNVAKLDTGVQTATTITSAYGINLINLTEPVDTVGSAIAAGAVSSSSSFKIGAATFNPAGKSLNQIITEINQSSTAGVVANFNTNTNKLELFSKSTGNQLITLEDTSGDFLQKMGLISGTDSTVSQTMGTNATFRINGGALITSKSNTVSALDSGLTGITLNLKKAQPGTDIQIDVSKNSTTLQSTLQDFVNQFNNLSSFIAQQTDSLSSTAQLKNDQGLIRLRNQLRTIASDFVSGLGTLNNLASIGISTGSPTASGAGSSNVNLLLDTNKLQSALQSDPAGVEKLLKGQTDSIFTRLQSAVDTALATGGDTTNGFFATRKATNQAQIKASNDNITRTQARLDLKEKQLRAQFSAMEKAIAAYQSQGNAISRIGQ